MMNMESRNQYLQTLIKQKGYHLLSKKEKSQLLDEYCQTTKQNRKYVIRKIRNGQYLPKRKRLTPKRRLSFYDSEILVYLVRLWEIFDYPCGLRLASSLKTEVDRLRDWGELPCSDQIALKLKKISPRTIDEKLRHEKEVRLIKSRYEKPVNPLIYQKILIKVFSDQDRTRLGQIQVDLVEHCGSSASGEYGYTLSTTDLRVHWWEGEAILTKGQRVTRKAIEGARSRYPFSWQGLHSDNGREFLNAHLYDYTQNTHLDFSRSRPYRKNDNFLVEQKNATHVRKIIGYLRYDTEAELLIINDLYRNELRLYKNFFQPVICLKKKERIGSKIKRKYNQPKTPYQMILDSKDIDQKTKDKLTATYQTLNPAQLQRSIKVKLDLLAKTYQEKQKASDVNLEKVLVPSTVTFLNCSTNQN